jgi:hypothetical protein
LRAPRCERKAGPAAEPPQSAQWLVAAVRHGAAPVSQVTFMFVDMLLTKRRTVDLCRVCASLCPAS